MKSGYVAACPRLTELTVLCPHPHLLPDNFQLSEASPLGPIRSAHSETIGLVDVCKALPNFETLQIVHFSLNTSGPVRGPEGERAKRLPLMNQASREQVEGMKGWALAGLKKPQTGHERVGRRKKTLRIIELSSSLTHLGYFSHPRYLPGPVKVEECEVWGVEAGP